MKIYSKKITDRLTREYHLVFPNIFFWGFLTVILMLTTIIYSIEINPRTIVFSIPIQVASTIFLFQGLIKRQNLWDEDNE